MNRRKVCSLSIAFLLGNAAVCYHFAGLWCILAFYGMVWFVVIRRTYERVRIQIFWCLLFGAVVFLGSYSCYRQEMYEKVCEAKFADNEECLVQGKIYKRQQDKEAYLYYLKGCYVQLDQTSYSCNQILLHLTTEEYSIGEILCVKGKIKNFTIPLNEGNYNEKAYYQSLNIAFQVEGKEVLKVSGKKCVYKELLYALKEKIKNSFIQVMPEEEAGVLVAMVLGDKSLMDAGQKKMYQNAGVSHFYSISGLHISMLGMALYYFLRKRGGSYFFSGIFAAVCMLSYGEMIGFGISADRAIGMFLLLLYAKFRGRSYDRATALSIMAVFLTGYYPKILQNAGFLLSFGAVAGVILAEMEGNSQGKKRGETFRISLYIQLVTIPILCQFFYEISVYSVFINLIILPCVGVLLGMGIVGGVVGCILPFAGKCMLFPCYLILQLFETVCKGFLKLPGAVLITGKMSIGKIVLWYTLLAVFIFVRRYRKNLKVFLMLIPFIGLLLFKKTLPFEIDILDVGQGDGIYLATGEGTSLFIDGGSSNVSKVGTYRILPFLKSKGVRRIDYWFVSHCDADHISGLLEIMESGYPIENLVVSTFVPEDEEWQNLRAVAEENGIIIHKMKPQDAVKSGHRNPEKNFQIQCLAPADFSSMQDRNAASLVLLYESASFRAFFGGDMGEVQEKELALENELPMVDVYKAAHHGSNTSNSMELLQEIEPECAVISCGAGNSYGHPHRETLERLKEAGCEVFRTDQIGEIHIVSGKSGTDFCVQGIVEGEFVINK